MFFTTTDTNMANVISQTVMGGRGVPFLLGLCHTVQPSTWKHTSREANTGEENVQGANEEDSRLFSGIMFLT